MKQAFIKKGKVFCDDVPSPNVSEGSLLIKVIYSSISAGTELTGVAESSKSLIKKALEQPEKVKKVLNFAKNEGILKAYHMVRGELDRSIPIGYSISGVVVGIGKGIKDFKIGDKVAAAGAGIANHAEYVDVPANLVVKMPVGLEFDKAATVALGAIALQGVRRAELKIGEFGVVYGTGIIGLLTVQLLKLSGVRIIAIDIDDKRLEIAKELGAELILNPQRDNVVDSVINFTGGYGADAVLFTASTTLSEPLEQSFKMTRKKGQVVLVGVVGMDIKREDIYKKELDFKISTSYGPGRYDINYEEKGLEYPYHYVRWTENRNMKEYLRLLKDGLINLERLISNVYSIDNVDEAFNALKSENKPLIVLLNYGGIEEFSESIYDKIERKIVFSEKIVKKEKINVAVVGMGGFAIGTHLPNLAKLKDKFEIFAIMDRTGSKAKDVAIQYNAKYATTDYNQILQDENIDLIIIATRHKSHGTLVLEALKAGKNVFVEKPLATTRKELEEIASFYKDNKNAPLLFVGFNRRFSKYIQEIKRHTDKRINPLFIRYRVNAGYIPLDNWVHEDGGRIVGELCHFIDLGTHLINCKIESVSCESLSPKTEIYSSSDNKSIILKYEDGSIFSVDYFSMGSKELGKEYMEIHFDGKSIILDDYKGLKGYGIKVNELKSNLSEKGHIEEFKIVYESLKNGKWPIDLWELIQTTEVTFDIAGVEE